MSDETQNEIMEAFGGADNLPTAFSAKALLQSVAKLPRSVDMPFLSFRDGEWTYGASQDECEDGSLWAINPRSFGIGLMEWCDSKPGGDVYVPMGTPYSDDDVTFKYDPKDPDWNLVPQVGAVLVCLDGADKGLKVLFKTSTRGGVDALSDLAQKIGQRAEGDEDADLFVPIITLEHDSYQHKKYGKKYVPIMKVQQWDDEDLTDTLAQLAQSEKPKKARRNAKTENETRTEQDDDSTESAPPARRRRRGR